PGKQESDRQPTDAAIEPPLPLRRQPELDTTTLANMDGLTTRKRVVAGLADRRIQSAQPSQFDVVRLTGGDGLEQLSEEQRHGLQGLLLRQLDRGLPAGLGGSVRQSTLSHRHSAPPVSVATASLCELISSVNSATLAVGSRCSTNC